MKPYQNSPPTGKPMLVVIEDVPERICRAAEYLAERVADFPAPGLIIGVDSELAHHPATMLAIVLGLIAIDGSTDGRWYILREPDGHGSDATQNERGSIGPQISGGGKYA